MCGANLNAIRQVVDIRDTDPKFDWSKTWVAEMFMSREEMKRRRGITPAIRRYQEIKAGIITSSVGVGVASLLFVLMEGIIRSGKVSGGEAEILSRLWIAGVIPLVVGIALIINGLLVSKKMVEVIEQSRLRPNNLEGQNETPLLSPADTTEFIPSNLSVTEGTTKHLGSPRQT
jgi:hypothetical protein